MENAIWTRASLLVVSAAVAALSLGCTPPTSAVAAVINEKLYSVMPGSVKVQAGIVSGELTELRVTERVEAGSGRVTTPAKLTGKLLLKNSSPDQSVRLIGAKLIYIDAEGQAIRLEDNRIEPALKLAASYGTPDRLDPGQDASQAVDAEFPVAALKAKRLKEIRLELSYIPSPFREQTLNFAVSIDDK